MRMLVVAAIASLVLATPGAYLGAHCEVPCGVFDDARRFAELHEDFETISKAIAGIEAELEKMGGGPEPLMVNQATRWVSVKEAHATNTQNIIAQYFMAQRIKADDPQYVAKLSSAHAVMVAAMKCKQTSDLATANSLHDAIDAFQKAYTGKDAHSHDH